MREELIKWATRTRFWQVPRELSFLHRRFVDLGFEKLGLSQADHKALLLAFVGEGVAVPGGAGHALRLENPDELLDVLRAAHARVANCRCGESASCYGCLRSFRNQYCHDQLSRGPRHSRAARPPSTGDAAERLTF